MIGQRRRYWAEVDMDAAAHNFIQIRSRLKNETKICCVIKANAYGNGAVQFARLYEKLGADFLAVSNIEEAMQLRLNGIKKPVLILGYTPAECAEILANNNISQAVFSEEYAEKLAMEAKNKNVRLKIHIKLDTGMGRIGFDCKHGDYLKALLSVCKLDVFETEGVFTHFANADSGAEGLQYTKTQFTLFCDAVEKLKENGVTFAIRHCANSGAVLDYPEYQLDMVRAGIILYGLQPASEILNPLSLKETLSLKAIVSQVKTIKKGDCISYGSTFKALYDMRVATVSGGYADGYLRSNGKNGAYILIHGKRAPILGRVCMDQMIVDVTDIENVHLDDVVTIMGEEQNEKIGANEIAALNGTIGYEIICEV
ncbi:MAG: alanine racemase, partial [Clostridia bacterium]|nr:alanine racemase [Clostridia bacterium]